jgi:hypothetical protein
LAYASAPVRALQRPFYMVTLMFGAFRLGRAGRHGLVDTHRRQSFMARWAARRIPG